MRDLRIHHFFDIIRDYGSGKLLEEHSYEHSYHLVGNEIFENRLTKIRLVIKNDDICEGCKYLSLGECTDTIHHRSDFKYKQEFNNYLDIKIMNCMGYKENQIVEIKEIIDNSQKYLDSIFEIYNGNDIHNTERRKQNVSSGIRKKKNELGL